ncbi:tetratricopeptide repeat protein [uncultured Aquimarina sp.]|uniref:tetratricopeptide repeat protein n=1 Tax=uncultured Aquimarina sp. TaxID=575652 RepID=UPI00261C1073|nr:tetratricopeptide repeat protein [uncultured Aquimarina sp.]
MIFYIKQFFAANYVVCLLLFFSLPTMVFAQNTLEIAKQYIQQGKSLYDNDHYDQSIEYFDKAVTIAKTLKNDSLLTEILIRKGHSFLLGGKNQEALDAYYDTLTITLKTKNIDQEIRTNSGLMLVLKQMNQLDKAYEIALHVLRSIDKTSFKGTVTHVNILTTISDIYLSRELYDEVLSFAKKGIEISKSLDYKDGLVDFYIKKGMIFYYQKKYDQSFGYLRDAQQILNQYATTNKFFPRININYFLASCYYEKGAYDQAIDQLLTTINVLEEKDKMKPLVIQSYLLLANCYGEQKDFEQALYWNNEYLQIHKDFQKDRDAIVNSIYQKEEEKLELKINTLTSEKEASDRNKKWIVGSLLLLFLVLGFVIFKYTQKQKNNKVAFSNLIGKVGEIKVNDINKEVIKETSKQIMIDDKKVQAILKQLNKLEDQEYYLRSDCTLREIAKKIKSNHTYLSKVIHNHKGKNFTNYINDLRIDYVLKRLKKDKKFRSFSITSIAKEIGYKSDYSFTKHFKTKTGLNPSSYIKNIENK